MEVQEFRVNVRALVDEQGLDDYDRDVAGTYVYRVTTDLRPGIIAEYLLDDFHSTIAISELDDFEITVLSPDSSIIQGDPEYLASSNDASLQLDFIGKVSQ